MSEKPPAPRSSFILIIFPVALVAITVIAFLVNVSLGAGFLIAISVSAIRVDWASKKWLGEPRSFGLSERQKLFATSMGEHLLVLISSAIAFVGIHASISWIEFKRVPTKDNNRNLAFWPGLLTALLVGLIVSALLIHRNRTQAAKDRKTEER